ncbi:MAG: DUF1295 domain-containing protein [Muribaculaceae bacterium]
MFESYIFNIFLWVMVAIGFIVFIALHFINAGYGMMYTRRWGIAINNRIGWVIMEAPVFIIMAFLWWFSSKRFDIVPLIFFMMFQLHYVQRSFIFPFLLKGRNKMPLSIILSGVLFNILNAFMQGGWIFYVSTADRYQPSWLLSPQFIIGTIIFFAGMVINLHSDYIIRHLRKPNDTAHYIPKGGMFRYVSSANYFGELLEWIGFAILTWSFAGAVFAWWTFANLAPRARTINKHYANEFGEKFTKLHLKSIIPFIY